MNAPRLYRDSVAFLRRQPYKIIIVLLSAWGLLAAFSWFLKSQAFYPDAPDFFPIAVFRGPQFHPAGLPFIVMFGAVLFLVLPRAGELEAHQIWFIGLSLILLGNLGQGGVYEAFLKPFTATRQQYYHDAIKIISWQEWLGDFNQDQALLLNHSQTHPPFAVLIHYLVLQLVGQNVLALSLTFILISSLTILILMRGLDVLGVAPDLRNCIGLLFAVLPAVNIYSAASLDALVMTAASLFLLGLIVIHRNSKALVPAALLCSLGFVLTNFLIYAGIFLFGAGALLAVREFILTRRLNVAIVTGISFGALLVVSLWLNWGFGYNHLQGFLTSGKLEYPEGFIVVTRPLYYLGTRIVDIAEIALFFSFGCLAVLIRQKHLGVSLFDFRDDGIAIAFAGILALGGIFLTGAFRKETARSCLFIYPFLILFFYKTENRIVRDMVVMAGFQTAIMQLWGDYFW